MSDDELILAVGNYAKYGRQWWLLVGCVSSGGERQYLLERDGDTARVPGFCIEAIKGRPPGSRLPEKRLRKIRSLLAGSTKRMPT